MDFAAIATGVITGVSVAAVSYFLGRRSERERWARDDALRRDAQDREARNRWGTERRELFGRLLRHADSIRDESRLVFGGSDPTEGWETAWDESYRVSVEIALVAPHLRDVAEGLHDQASALWTAAQESRHQHRGEPPLSEREIAFDAAYEAFIKAAQGDLT